MILAIEEQHDAAGQSLPGGAGASSDEDEERGDDEWRTLTPGYGPVSGRLFPRASSGQTPFRGPGDVDQT